MIEQSSDPKKRKLIFTLLDPLKMTAQQMADAINRIRAEHGFGAKQKPESKVESQKPSAGGDFWREYTESRKHHTVFSSYSGFRNATLSCHLCGWSGQGREMKVGEVYERGEVSEYHCPRCGGQGDYLAVAPWPLIGESQE